MFHWCHIKPVKLDLNSSWLYSHPEY